MKRSGLSTIVGATFFVLVMGSTIGYVTYSMDVIDDLAYQVDVKQDTNLNRQNEAFEITNVRVDGNEFNLTVTNTGTIPINITNMWAKNMTDPLWNQTKYQLNQIVSPGQSVSNIGQGTGLIAMNSESYSLRMVTDRGNALSTHLLSAAGQPLQMTLFTSPSSPNSKQNVTLLYSVKNNLTAGKIIQSITPQMDPPTTTGAATAVLKSGPTPTSVDSLSPGEMAFFEWTYYVEGNKNNQITYNATIANAVPGNFVTDLTQIAIPPVSQSSINEVLGGLVGVLQMDFDSFEFCDFNQVNCETDTNNWFRAWNGTINTEYIWRINMTNSGEEDIFIEEHTAMLVLRAQSGGGGGIAKAMFVLNNSTATLEDGGLYPDHGTILLVNVTQTLYFGEDQASNGHQHETTHPDDAIYAANLLIFGHADTNGNGIYDIGTDIAYSQNLPFQALKLD